MKKSIFAKCGMYQLFALCLSAGVRLLSTGPSSAKEAQLQEEKGKSPSGFSFPIVPFTLAIHSGNVGSGCTAMWGRGVHRFWAAELFESSGSAAVVPWPKQQAFACPE